VTRQPRNARRAPDFTAFLITGGLVGLLIGVFLGLFGPEDARYGTSAAVGFFGVFCAALGALLGGVVAVLLDKRV